MVERRWKNERGKNGRRRRDTEGVDPEMRAGQRGGMREMKYEKEEKSQRKNC